MHGSCVARAAATFDAAFRPHAAFRGSQAKDPLRRAAAQDALRHPWPGASIDVESVKSTREIKRLNPEDPRAPMSFENVPLFDHIDAEKPWPSIVGIGDTVLFQPPSRGLVSSCESCGRKSSRIRPR